MKTMFPACGQKILLEYSWTGLLQQVCYRHPVTQEALHFCPGCGETLSEEVLHGEIAEMEMRKLFGDAL